MHLGEKGKKSACVSSAQGKRIISKTEKRRAISTPNENDSAERKENHPRTSEGEVLYT